MNATTESICLGEWVGGWVGGWVGKSYILYVCTVGGWVGVWLRMGGWFKWVGGWVGGTYGLVVSAISEEKATVRMEGVVVGHGGVVGDVACREGLGGWVGG